MSRKRASKRTRFEIFKRDHFACQYCGRTPPGTILELDHIIPVSSGGDSGDENLVTACLECNRGKGAVSLEAVPQSLADSMKLRKERSEQLQEYEAFLSEERARLDAYADELGRYWFNCFVPEGERDEWVFGTSRLPTIRRFLQNLPKTEVIECMDIAMAWRLPFASDKDGRTFRYFCGVAWRRIRDL